MSTTDTITFLPEDFTGTATTNFIQNEVHKSESIGVISRFVISPAEGAFYDTDNLKVVFHTKTRDTTLVRDNDYKLVGIDYGRTKVSSAEGGVYHFIMLTTTLVYDNDSYITIDYQAFGGYMSSRAYSALLQEISDLESKLEREGIITAENIASNETIQTITTQLQAICMRLQYSPSVQYLAKVSGGKDTTWQTFAVSNDSYDQTIDFSDPSTLQGLGVFTFFGDEFITKVALTYDLTQKYPNTLYVFNGTVKADVLYQHIPELDTSVELSDQTFFQNKKTYIPKFRIAFDSSTTATHKVYLQFAIAGTADKTIPMFITDSTDMHMDDVANKYVLSTDLKFLASKKYYVRTGTDSYWRYTEAQVTVGESLPVPNTIYYELISVSAVHNASLASRFVLCQRSGSVEPPSLDEGLTTSNFTHGVLALKAPFKIWEGNVNLAWVQELSYATRVISEEYNVLDQLGLVKTTAGYPAIPFCPKECLDASIINEFVVDVYDRWEKKLIQAVFPAKVADPYAITTYVVPKKINGNGCYYIPDLCYLDIDLTLSDTTSVLNIYAKSGKSSYANKRFDLRTIYIR